MTPFEALGGQEVLAAIIRDFVEVMVRDPMIGFFFRSVDRDRLERLELQFTGRFLGAPMAYEGRPMRAAHAAHRIMGGQFDRRRQLLKETLQRHGVAAELQTLWLGHVDALRGQITGQGPAECD